MNNPLSEEEIQALQHKLEELRLEHRDLDDVIHHLVQSDYPDQLQLKRLKMRKLRLRDSIEIIQSRLIPDLDA
ncbi:YdcH family protein [Thiogranum longum]|uniref:YdcH family protein n=1 Tax=Thiogranum longum TaxID=1537524 RepID=UPI0010540917